MIDPRIEAYGTVDELNAIIGQARATPLEEQVDETLGEIQNYLFVVGAELATPDPQASQLQRVDAGAIEVMEERIDAFEKQLAPLNQFILPGGTPEAAHLHVARTVCRRAERRVVTLARSSDDEIAPTLIDQRQVVLGGETRGLSPLWCERRDSTAEYLALEV